MIVLGFHGSVSLKLMLAGRDAARLSGRYKSHAATRQQEKPKTPSVAFAAHGRQKAWFFAAVRLVFLTRRGGFTVLKRPGPYAILRGLGAGDGLAGRN
jgi:hypothetical protein